MSIVIKIENLSKKYVIGHQRQEKYTALRDVIMHKLRGVGERLLHPLSPNKEETSLEDFWALKDINLEIKQGDRVGIIGRNGAGKSTLLKILSRITEPTTGRITINGRVASLLEVGTGFHPELTGRENIFLNGAILGMSRMEIKRKFDEIVDFAEVEKFLDTPIKRYSSGMYVRLAFAVAAHLEPEILIVDEVLAVGDARFQKKCLGKMEEVGKEGRTVLFVSHNMNAIRQLCESAILLKTGFMLKFDNTQRVTELYLRNVVQELRCNDLDKIIKKLPDDPTFKLKTINLLQEGYSVNSTVRNGLPLEISINYEVKQKVTGLRIYIEVLDDQETILFRSFHDEDNDQIVTTNPGSYVSKVVIPAGILAPFQHILCIKAGIYNVRYTMPRSGIKIPLQVEQTSSYNRAYPGDRLAGRFALVLNWDTLMV